jgi:dTDP-4-dehydrorhamnose reductase
MYIIFGASGFLGSYLVDQAVKITKEPILATFHSSPLERTYNGRVEWHKLNFADLGDLNGFCGKFKAADRKGLKVIVLVARHNLDKVKKDPDAARHINVTALAKLVDSLPGVKSFYYVSSDTVYGESENGRFFDENDPPNPINLYGEQKAQAEKIVIAAGLNLIRCSFLIGPSLSHKKHFYDEIVDTLSSGKTIEMFTDSRRTALDLKQTAEYLVRLIERFGNEKVGIVNFAGDEALSKYDIGLRIAAKLGLDPALIRPVSLAESGFFAEKRAKSILMKNAKLKKLLNLSSIKLEL